MLLHLKIGCFLISDLSNMENMSELDLPYRSEYAKSGRSSCKACKTSIGKADLRIAAMVKVNTKFQLLKFIV